MTVKTTPGAKGVIWSSGVHNVFVNKKPAKVHASRSTIPKTFDVFQEEIDKNGGITLGIDHLPDELLEVYPLLAKLNVLDVGKITEIAHDGEKIYATKSEHTNPLIAELFLNGELPAYSIVADFKASPCQSGKADYVIKEINSIKRTDYVDKGGCADCKTGIVPDDMILTAKLSMEVDKLTEPNQDPKNKEPQANPAQDPKADPQKNDPGQDPKQEPAKTDPDPKQDPDPQDPEPKEQPLTLADVKQTVVDTIKELVPDMVKGETQKVEAKLATVQKEAKLEAKKANVEKDIEGKIMAGYATPAMKKSLIAAGVACEDDEEYKELLASLSTKLWEGGRLSKPSEIIDDDGNEVNFEESRKTIRSVLGKEGE